MGEGQPLDQPTERLRCIIDGQTAVRIVVDGDFGPKEIARLIRCLELHREFFADDQDERARRDGGEE